MVKPVTSQDCRSDVSDLVLMSALVVTHDLHGG